MSLEKMSLEQAEREGARAIEPARMRVDISQHDGETKAASAEAFGEVARAALSKIKIPVPGGSPIDGLDAFAIGCEYHETGFELTFTPRPRVFRKALGTEQGDILLAARQAGARLPIFRSIALRAAKAVAPQVYERASRAMLDLIAKEFAQRALGEAVSAVAEEMQLTLGPAVERALASRKGPAP